MLQFGSNYYFAFIFRLNADSMLGRIWLSIICCTSLNDFLESMALFNDVSPVPIFAKSGDDVTFDGANFLTSVNICTGDLGK